MAEDIATPLAGKVAYVTGAARGQGRSHCIRLARAGVDIVAIDACAPVAQHNGYPPATPEELAETVSLVEGEGRKILADEVDVRDLAGQQRVVSNAVEQFGRLDIVVANAGVLNWGRLWEISAQQWQETLDTNLTGLWNTMKSVVPAMIDAGTGGRSSTSAPRRASRPCRAAVITAQPNSGSSASLTRWRSNSENSASASRCTPTGPTPRWATACRCTRCFKTTRTTSTASHRARCRPIRWRPPT